MGMGVAGILLMPSYGGQEKVVAVTARQKKKKKGNGKISAFPHDALIPSDFEAST